MIHDFGRPAYVKQIWHVLVVIFLPLEIGDINRDQVGVL